MAGFLGAEVLLAAWLISRHARRSATAMEEVTIEGGRLVIRARDAGGRENLAELDAYWPGERRRYRTLMLAPPIHRLLARAPWMMADLLSTVAPPLRSHFMYMVQKGG